MTIVLYSHAIINRFTPSQPETIDAANKLKAALDLIDKECGFASILTDKPVKAIGILFDDGVVR